MRIGFSRLGNLAAAVRHPDEGDWAYARRLRDRGALLSLLVPLLSTHPVLVTQIVDRKNADEWALVLAVAACVAVSYISRFRRRRRDEQNERGPELTEGVVTAVRRIRAALRSQALALVMVPLALSTPWAASNIVGRHNVDIWMCFFGVLGVVELWRAARIWKEAARDVHGQLVELAGTLRSGRPAERYELELQLGRRLFSRLERLEIASVSGDAS